MQTWTELGPLRLRPSVWVQWAFLGLGAAVVRLALVDRTPLDSAEARYAWTAWQAGQGVLEGSLAQEHSPLFSHLTAVLFWLFGASDTAARLLPAIAGAAAAIVPVLLAPLVGTRASLLVGLILATSPIAVELSRRAHPASLTSLLALFGVVAALRWANDRPRWAPWTLAAATGLGLANESASVIALVTGAVAALAATVLPIRSPGVSIPPRAVTAGEPAHLMGIEGEEPLRRRYGQLRTRFDTRRLESIWRPAALGAGLALLASTGGLTDLRGLGFLVGDVWGGAAGIVAFEPASLLNVWTLFFYAGPVLVLGLVGFVVIIRGGDELGTSLGVWLALLIPFGVMGREEALSLLLLPLVPGALLAGVTLDRVPWQMVLRRMDGLGWAAVAASAGGGALALVSLANVVGAGRQLQPAVAVLGVGTAAFLVRTWWVCAQRGQQWPPLVVLGLGLYALGTAGCVGRVSFGGSPPGSEPLRREETHVQFRALFRELRLRANVDPRLTVALDPNLGTSARWYAREVRQPASPVLPPEGAVVIRKALEDPAGPAVGTRVPWRTRSRMESGDLHPLGLARWAISRVGFIVGRAEDALVTRR